MDLMMLLIKNREEIKMNGKVKKLKANKNKMNLTFKNKILYEEL